jgi:hypothetical protein
MPRHAKPPDELVTSAGYMLWGGRRNRPRKEDP